MWGLDRQGGMEKKDRWIVEVVRGSAKVRVLLCISQSWTGWVYSRWQTSCCQFSLLTSCVFNLISWACINNKVHCGDRTRVFGCFRSEEKRMCGDLILPCKQWCSGEEGNWHEIWKGLPEHKLPVTSPYMLLKDRPCLRIFKSMLLGFLHSTLCWYCPSHRYLKMFFLVLNPSFQAFELCIHRLWFGNKN